jgi:hypothetical protein
MAVKCRGKKAWSRLVNAVEYTPVVAAISNIRKKLKEALAYDVLGH